MNDIAGIRGAGTFVALGTYVSMPSDGVQWREVMIDTGNRFSPVTLAAGEVGPYGMNVSGLLNVTGLASSSFIKLDTQMGVRQTGANSHRSSCGAVREKTASDPWNTLPGGAGDAAELHTPHNSRCWLHKPYSAG